MPTFKNNSSLDNLTLRLIIANERSIPIGKCFGKSATPFTAFWFILSGQMLLELGDEKYVLNPGDIAINSPFVPHHAETLGSEPVHYLSLACDIKVGVFDLVKLFRFPPMARLEDFSGTNNFIMLWKSLIEEFSNHIAELTRNNVPSALNDNLIILTTYQTIKHLHINASLSQWLSLLMGLIQAQLPECPLAIDSRIQKVCTFIQNNMEKKLTLNTLANHVYLSESRLQSLFCSNLKLPLRRYVTQSKLDRAKQLLLNTEYSLKEITSMIGMEDQSVFSRIFRLHTGISPSQYRKHRTLENGSLLL